MQSGRKLICKLGALALALTALVGAAAYAAGAGTSSDPLVTVSYLENTFTPSVTASVNAQISAARTSLDDALAARVRSFEANLAQAPAQTGAQAGDYVSLTLAAGQTLDVTPGAELLFLSGKATAAAALTDTTAGASVASGGALSAYHLYIATGTGTVTASAESKLLVKIPG